MSRILIAAIGLFLLCGCRASLTKPPKGDALSYNGILAWAEENGTPGSALVVLSPRTNLFLTRGAANIRARDPLTINHQFRIASLSKSYVGVLAGIAAAEGKLNLDAPITDYLPKEITARIANAGQITTRHLLRHTSGICDFERSLAHTIRRYLTDRRGEWTPHRDLSYAFDKPADFVPGAQWRYSTSGFILVGLILDEIYRRDHAFEIRDRLLTPLNLTNTFSERLDRPRGPRASGYERWFGLWRTDVTDWAPMTGAMVATAPDVAKFYRSIVRNDAFLDARTREVIWGNRDKGELRYDFGISLTRANDTSPWFFGHAGAAAGYLTLAYHEPERDLTVVYMCNTSHMHIRGVTRKREEFANTITRALLELALKDSAPNRSSPP